jgi:ESX secretion-associated protein EspG
MTLVFGPENDRAVLISALEFDVLWEHLGLRTMPLALKVPSPGRTHTERAGLVDQVWRALAGRDLGHGGTLDGHLESLLRLLDHPDREVDGRFGRNRSVRWLAVSRADDAALATLDRRGLTLRPAAASGLAREAVSGLPAIPPGPGESITLPSAALDAAASGASTPDDFRDALIDQGIRARDAAVLRDTVAGAKRQGQFGAATRDRWGKRRRASRVIGFFDNENGRYLQTRRPGPDGIDWTTISPADNRLIARELAAILDEAG